MELTATINRSGTVLDGKMALAPCTATEKVAAHNVSMDAHPHIREAIHKVSSYSDIVCTQMGDVVSVQDASERKLAGLHIYGKTTQDGTPTPDNPVELVSAGASGSIGVTVAGKNILDVPETLSFTGSVKALQTIPKGTYVVSCGNVTYGGNKKPAIAFYNSAKGMLFNLELPINGTKIITLTEDSDRQTILSNGYDFSGSNGVSTTINQLMISVDGGEYKPCVGSILTAQTPNGLPGIPVSSGGNYTDENGQQWICDEIDFGKGVYVKRVKSVAFDGTEEFFKSGTKQFAFNVADTVSTHATTVDAFCSHFTYSSASWGSDVTGFVKHNYYVYLHYMELTEDSVSAFKAYLVEQYANETPVTVQYVLVTPIETALSAEELAQYAALHTNEPNTTVFNDAGAGLQLQYYADPKCYIDNKFTALQHAILSVGANI